MAAFCYIKNVEKEKQTSDVILYFVLDGIKYALKQNAMTQEQAYEKLKTWFPDVEILPRDLNES